MQKLHVKFHNMTPKQTKGRKTTILPYCKYIIPQSLSYFKTIFSKLFSPEAPVFLPQAQHAANLSDAFLAFYRRMLAFYRKKQYNRGNPFLRGLGMHCILSDLEHAALRCPNKIAVADATCRISFSELRTRARTIGSALREYRAQPIGVLLFMFTGPASGRFP